MHLALKHFVQSFDAMLLEFYTLNAVFNEMQFVFQTFKAVSECDAVCI